MGTEPEAAGDVDEITALKTQIDAVCQCQDYDGSVPGKKHGDFVRCAKTEILAAVTAGDLRRQCTGTLKKIYATSTCGFPPPSDPAKTKVPCVKEITKNGKVTCAVKPENKCVDKPGTFTQQPCADYDFCLDAADDNGNYIFLRDPTGGDDGSCEGAECGDGVQEEDEECDDGNTVDGDCCSSTCKLDPSGQPCGDAGTECVNQDTCNGAGSCVDNGFVTSGTSCGATPTECSAQDTCDGTGTCQPNDSAAGTSCDDGLYCNGTDTCSGGVCTHSGDPCLTGPECADSCNETAGHCYHTAGTPCTDDGNLCTDNRCDGAGTCAANNNTASCDDGLYCNGTDTCSGGVCTHSGDPCLTGPECADSCNEITDDCFDSLGTACTSDGNICTNDVCDGAGACTHGDTCGGCPEPWNECADTGGGICSCTPTCYQAQAPACGGACPAGEECSDLGGSCGCSQAACASGSYDMNVLLVIYYHLNEQDEPVDPNNVDTTLLFGDTLVYYRDLVQQQVDALREGLEASSSYRGYADSWAQPALRYHIVDTFEHYEPVPYIPFVLDPSQDYLDYFTVMQQHNICDYVTQQGVQEVWLLIPPHFQDRQGQSESKMSGPHGDISNSWRLNEMPQCGQTYRTYTHNYDRSDMFPEVWGHQLEHEFYAVDHDLFKLFQGPCYGSDDYGCAPLADPNAPIIGRCGNVHTAPNGRHNYDRWNDAPNLSDCLDWDPDGLGTLSEISCHTWGCDWNAINDNPVHNYLIWMWQNLPGIGNDITYQGNRLRSWWDIHGDWDRVMSEDRTLLCTDPNP